MEMETAGQWLEKALIDLCAKVETGLDLDRDIISGLVSYCDLAQPTEAKEYLDNIIGEEVAKSVIEEYLQQRGYGGLSSNTSSSPTSNFQAYVKPKRNKVASSGTKKSSTMPNEVASTRSQAGAKNVKVPLRHTEAEKDLGLSNQGNINGAGNSKKKKGGKIISLAEAAKGSIVFQQGKPCSCQARRHGLVSNCLSCGKIVCKQEGEGPCTFCGALVLKEGSTYAGLDEGFSPLSDAEAAAEIYAKRLVDYDRNAAARTTVIDDQSDYYEIEGNTWLSKEEKELLTKKREAIEEAERAKKSKVVLSFDLVGRKVLLNEDEVSELESENRILRAPDEKERNRIKPNPSLRVQPIFIEPGPDDKKPSNPKKKNSKNLKNGLCLEITGRVQHDRSELNHFKSKKPSNGKSIDGSSSLGNEGLHVEDGGECSVDYD